MRKKSIAFVLVGSMLVGNLNLIFAQGFEGREDEMNKKCAVVTDKATLNECIQYKEYLQNKSQDLDNQITDIKNQASNLQGDIDKMSRAISENTSVIQDYSSQISSIQATIDSTQANIDDLNVQIEKKQADIKKRDESMKKRLVEMQAYVGSNNYIDFIMGSTGFSDLLRRTQIVGELNSYENDQIKAIQKEKEKLNEDRETVEVQKELLEIQVQDIDNKKKLAVALNESNKSLIASYQNKQADLNAASIEREMLSSSIKSSLPTISTTIPPELGGGGGNNSGNGNGNGNDNGNGSGSGNENGGDTGEGDNGGNTGGDNGSGLSSYMMSPMSRNTWEYHYGTWEYPGGGVHLGMDMSTGTTTRIPIVAPAAGIVLTTYSGCAEYGSLGSTCGLAWAGNAVLMAVQLSNGQSYVIGMYHMYAPSVSSGQIVSQGQQIGLSGSSGNSGGPHCHVEVTSMGNMSLQEIVNTWNANITIPTGNPHIS
ncbi:MAG: peptidoglycan DD-metalloendopeptidase family protein, partial [Longicatena sp.]